MRATNIYRIACLVATISLSTVLSLPVHADIYTWEGDVSADMSDNGNWVGSPVVDFITGDDQWVFGSSLGSVTPQLGPGDAQSISWAGQTAAGAFDTAISFAAGAPAYTIGNGGDIARGIGLWTATTGSADMVNNSGNTQTFNVLVRQRRSTIDAAAGDIVFNGEFRVGDAQNSTAYSAIFKGDDNIYLNGPVTGYVGTGTNRSRIFYQGASTTAENAGKLYLGDIGATYENSIIVDSVNGGAVVARHNNSFGAFGSSAKLGTQIGSGTTGATSNGVVELDGSASDLTIPESFRLGMRTLANGATHIRNTAGSNTISGFISLNQPSTAGESDSAFIESTAGKLTVTGSFSNDRPNTTSFLYFKGAGAIDLGGVDGIYGSFDTNTSILNVDKTGTGAVTTLAGTANGYSGTTTIHEGSFILNGTHNPSTGATAGPATSAPYTVNANGTLGGSGSTTSTVLLSGKIAPGAVGTAGTFTIGGMSTLTGVLDFQLNSTDHTAGSGINDLILIGGSGPLDLSGGATLNVSGIGGNLTAGDYDLIQFAGSLTGTAANITLGTIPLGAGLSASIVIDSNSVNLRVGAGLHAGDFDGDGDVDGADFVAWQTNFPTATGATLAQGDADGDGDVDGADFVVWQTNFPFTPGPGSSPVPEPNSIIVASLALVALAIGRRRRLL
jgi:hypothetical protein